MGVIDTILYDIGNKDGLSCNNGISAKNWQDFDFVVIEDLSLGPYTSSR